jgi:gas vesicle protein
MLTFLAGAALGAVVVALATPRSGPELRGDLKAMARRAKRRANDLAGDAGEAWDEMKTRTMLAAGDLKRGVSASVDDLRGRPAGTSPIPTQNNTNEVNT